MSSTFFDNNKKLLIPAIIGGSVIGLLCSICVCCGLLGLFSDDSPVKPSSPSLEVNSRRDKALFQSLVGKSKEEVLEKVGRPRSTRSATPQYWEAWVYSDIYDPIADKANVMAIVYFSDDKVVQVDL